MQNAKLLTKRQDIVGETPCGLPSKPPHNGTSHTTKPTKKDSTEIGLIMQNMTDWEKQRTGKHFNEFGVQRWWMKRNLLDFEEII